MANNEAVVIYHHPCFDGAGAAWIAQKALEASGNAVTLFATNYGIAPSLELIKDKDVYIVDFSYPLQELNAIYDCCNSLVVLDHHKGAQPVLAQFCSITPETDTASIHYLDLLRSIIFDNSLSGVGLTWAYFYGPLKPLPWLLAAIQDRDLWKFELAGTKEIIAALGINPISVDNIDRAMRNADKVSMLQIGTAILQQQQTQIESIYIAGPERIFWEDSSDMVDTTKAIPIYNCPYWLASEFGNYVAKQHGACITYHINSKGIFYSFRSTDAGPDVAEIAKKLGGGGHRNAAGVNYPVATVDAIRFNCIPTYNTTFSWDD